MNPMTTPRRKPVNLMALFVAFVMIITVAIVDPASVAADSSRYLKSNDVYFFEQCGEEQTEELGKVYVLGDSITLGAKSEYEKKLKSAGAKSVKVSAAGGGNLEGPGSTGTKQSGIESIKEDSGYIKDSNVIIIAHGTNQLKHGNPSEEVQGGAIKNALSEIESTGTKAKIYWVDVSITDRASGNVQSYAGAINRTIYKNKDAGYSVISWSKVVDPNYKPEDATGPLKHNPELIGSDGVHLTAEGNTKLVDTVVGEAKGSGGGGGSKSSGGSINVSDNKDYKGNPVFTEEHLEKIKENQSVYEKAADQVGIPWQMIAVIHARETVLDRINPANGQGVYQDAAKLNGPYPTGPVSEAEFLRQTIWAAELLKSKTELPGIEEGDEKAVKDAFFGYNGKSAAYAAQGQKLGFPADEPWEGSPYVMNIADEKRDPEVNKTTWGQVKRDYGPIEYPANGDHGAYIMYLAIGGMGSSSEDVCEPKKKNSGDFDGTLLDYAWPDPIPTGDVNATDGYKEKVIKESRINRDLYVGGTIYPAIDCGGFTTRLTVDSGFEPEYNYSGSIAQLAGPTEKQHEWNREHREKVGDGPIDPAKLEKGDIAMQEGHTFIFVGEVDGFNGDTASASWDERAPAAGGNSATEPATEWYRKK